MDRSVVLWTIFLVLSLGLIGFTPGRFIGEIDYDPGTVSLPSEFDAWSLLPEFTNMTQDLDKYPPDARTTFDFSLYGNSTLKVEVQFNWLWVGKIQLYQLPTANLFFAYNIPFNPGLFKDDLIAGWDNENNVTLIEFTNPRGRITGTFRDQNDTRNNIGTAWDDGEIELTITVPHKWGEDNDLGAREVVLALLTFNLGSIFTSISPTMGFLMSASLMIPLMFVTFSVVMWALHGEG